MIQVEINPKDKKEEIINYLNICFPGWGDNKTYAWYFEQKLIKFLPDIILFKNKQNEVIAGSAVSYRQIKVGEFFLDIGIMTGSWTLPNARGMGCFTKMIEVSKTLCHEKGVHFLTAFVTEDNASYRRLKEAGSTCIPANNYFFESSENHFEKINLNWIDTNKLNDYKSTILDYFSKANGFNYNLETFQKQYLERLHETKVFVFNQVLYVIEIAKVIKILFVSEIIIDDLKLVFSHLNHLLGKKIMWFCSHPNIISLNLDFLETKKGFFTMTETSKSPLNTDELVNNNESIFLIQLGDKV